MDEIVEKVRIFNKGVGLFNQAVVNFRETISHLGNGLTTLKSAIPDLETSGKGFLELRGKYEELRLYYPDEFDKDIGQWLNEFGSYLLKTCTSFEFFAITVQSMVDNPPTLSFVPKFEMPIE